MHVERHEPTLQFPFLAKITIDDISIRMFHRTTSWSIIYLFFLFLLFRFDIVHGSGHIFRIHNACVHVIQSANRNTFSHCYFSCLSWCIAMDSVKCSLLFFYFKLNIYTFGMTSVPFVWIPTNFSSSTSRIDYELRAYSCQWKRRRRRRWKIEFISRNCIMTSRPLSLSPFLFLCVRTVFKINLNCFLTRKCLRLRFCFAVRPCRVCNKQFIRNDLTFLSTHD